MRDDLDRDLDLEEAAHPGARARIEALAALKVLAFHLRMRREHASLTQRAVAARMGSTQALVSDLEAGKDVALSTLLRYYTAIGAGDAAERLAAK